MDGFDENCKIVVIAATNREKFLDFALVRSGRFDLKIPVQLPSKNERTGILLLKLSRTQHSVGESDAIEFGETSEGMSGADIDAIANEAIYLAKGLGETSVTYQHIQNAQLKIQSNLIKVMNDTG
jgi:cell division protease FtsH